MIAVKETVYNVDRANKKIYVSREFDAPVELVWKAWTTKELLDEWWAPKPWKTNTISMDLRTGGRWLYYMEGPDGSRHYCLVNYEALLPGKSFTGDDAFCDENGNINKEFPSMHWQVNFNAAGNKTKVDVEITFRAEEDLDKIVEMGFKEGFAMAHSNLDELLAR
jgi:uncharacterized protein YndB with AHSA1/START domain